MAKILIVEDNELNRDILSRMLQNNGYDIIIATDGSQALEMAPSENPDLIIMDLSLPVIDGWEVTRHLKSSDLTSDIPIIIVSAHALMRDKEQAFEAGCDDYDVKPIDFPRLLSKIEVQLEKQSKK